MSLIQAPEAVAAPAVADPPAAAVATPPVATPEAALASALTPPADAVTEPAAAQAEAPVRPEGLPDSLWDAASGVKINEAVTRLAELEAAEATRAADIPADAAGYKLEPPEPILDPATGKAITFNAEDPLAKAAVAWAHETGVGQAALSKLLGEFAKNEMATLAAHNAAVAAETAKLGANSEARFAAVSKALTAHAGEAGAKAIMSTLGSADAVIALEAVIKKLTGPSVVTPPTNPSKTPDLDGLHGVDALSALLK